MSLDDAAFEQLYAQEYGHIRATFAHRLPGRDLSVADDLAGDVFLKVWAARARYSHRPDAPLMAWVRCIARNVLIDYIRAERPATSLDARVAVGLDPIVPDWTPAIEWQIVLSAAISALKPRQRAVIVGQFLDGYEQRELTHISTLFGVKEIRKGAIRNLRRALRTA